MIRSFCTFGHTHIHPHQHFVVSLVLCPRVQKVQIRMRMQEGRSEGRMHFRLSRRVTYSAADCCGGVALGIEEDEEMASIYDVCKVSGFLTPPPLSL